MAPRGGRHCKKTSRMEMDAAVDAMIPFGFPETLVRSKMNQHLKEYGGDVGYPFIEAEAYKVLIDAILADEDEESKQGEHSSKMFADRETSMKDDLLEDEMVGDQAALVTVVPSGENVEPEGSQTPNTTTQNNRRAQGYENNWIDNQTSGSQDMIIVEATDNIGGEYSAEDVNLLDPPPILVASSSAEQLTSRKRKPCYGWIGDGEDDDNFVILTPAVAPI